MASVDWLDVVALLLCEYSRELGELFEKPEKRPKSKHYYYLCRQSVTWLVLKTNFVPLVKLSVTIIRFFREGLRKKKKAQSLD